MHAYALEFLKDNLKPNSRVLDIGSGSGYLLAAFLLMTNKKGKIYGIEHISDLVEFSKKNLSKNFSESLNNKQI